MRPGRSLPKSLDRLIFPASRCPLPRKPSGGEQTRFVGNKEVRLIEVGPAHTQGDILVHIPEDRAIYTGDILFIEGTPILWEGPVSNWVAACDLIESLDLEFIIPGHGPLTDKAGVRAVRDYLSFLAHESRQRYDVGMSAEDAARDIDLGPFSDWLDAERIVINVSTLYGEFAGNGGSHKPNRAIRTDGCLAPSLELGWSYSERASSICSAPAMYFWSKTHSCLFSRADRAPARDSCRSPTARPKLARKRSPSGVVRTRTLRRSRGAR